MILIYSDLHIKKQTRISGNFLRDNLATIAELTRIKEENNVTTIIFLGDIFETIGTVSFELMDIAYTEIEKLHKNVNSYFLVGNHDLSRGKTILRSFPGKIIDLPQIRVIEGIKFYFYPSGGTWLVSEEADVLLAHIALKEGELDASNVKLHNATSVSEFANTFPLGFLGHFHCFQMVLPDRYWYVGSPLQLSFGEAGQKKYCLLFDGNNIEWKQMTAAREFITIQVDKEVKEIILGSTTDELNEQFSKYIVKFIIPGTDKIFQRLLERKEPLFDFVVEYMPLYAKPNARNEIIGVNMHEVVKNYIELIKPGNPDSLYKKGMEIIENVGVQEFGDSEFFVSR